MTRKISRRGWDSIYKAESEHTFARNAYGAAPLDVTSFSEIAAGIRAVMKARDYGALSEEQAADILKALVTAYVSERISHQLGNYIEQGFAQMLERQMEG